MDDTAKLELFALANSLRDAANEFHAPKMQGFSASVGVLADKHIRTARRVEAIVSSAEQRQQIRDEVANTAPASSHVLATLAREFLDCFHGETVVRPLSYDDARKNLDTALKAHGH